MREALLMDANSWNNEYDELLEALYKSFDICKRFQCTLLRAAEGLLLAKDFGIVKDLYIGTIKAISFIWSQSIHQVYTTKMFHQKPKSWRHY